VPGPAAIRDREHDRLAQMRAGVHAGATAPPDRRRIVMSQGGNVTLVGFVATQPKVRYVNSNIPVANMRIGATVRKIDRETGEWRDGETSFYSVTCWRALARNAATCLHKGEPIIVTGKMRVNQWQDRAGGQRSEVVVDADTIGFDLTRGVAQFSRLKHSPDDGLNFGEAIRSGLVAEAGEGAMGQTDGMFDEHAIAELDQELDASAAEPVAG
jgi:single-strand DNA-binding protein